MKLLWQIISSRRPGHELMGWAADSRIGGAFLMATWLAAHGVFAGYAITGKGGFDRTSDSFFHWLDIGVFGLVLVVMDGVVIRGLWQERKSRRLNLTERDDARFPRALLRSP